MGYFSTGPINKAVQSFRQRLREYVKVGGKHFEHLLSKRPGCHDYRHRHFVNSVHNAIKLSKFATNCACN